MKNSIVLALGVIAILFSSCSDDDKNISPIPGTTETDITLNISGLEDLGEDYAYEGWIIVDGAPVTTGIFNVDSNGNLSETTFTLDSDDVNAATAFVLTIEPSPDNDPAPSAVHILAGDIENTTGLLTVDHPAAINTNFENATGSYILATPTDGGSDTDENSGLWFLDISAGPGPGLDLPALPEGWAYEGWAVIDGVPVSTGTFIENTGADDFDGFSGAQNGPPFPGEDFLVNAPEGLTFPVDLAGETAVISVEPVPDNSPTPFLLKPLVGPIPVGALDHTLYEMNNNATATNPTGTVNIIK